MRKSSTRSILVAEMKTVFLQTASTPVYAKSLINVSTFLTVTVRVLTLTRFSTRTGMNERHHLVVVEVVVYKLTDDARRLS